MSHVICDEKVSYKVADDSLEGIDLSLNEADLSKCVICQRKGGGNLSSEQNGRDKIIDTSAKLNDNLVVTIDDDLLDSIKYHMKCYRSYIRKGDRATENTKNEESAETSINIAASVSKRLKRDRKSVDGSSSTNICIICNKSKHKNDKETFRICEVNRAKLFLEARKFNLDDVYTRTSTLESVEDVFAADIMCHKNCINNYLVKYSRVVSNEESYKETTCDEQTFAFSSMISKLELERKGYSVSECRDIVNLQLCEELHVDNRKIKEVLLGHYGDSICFTYPRDRSQSQMFYSCNIASQDMAEIVRKKDVVKECAEILKRECKLYDFNLDDKFCDADDLKHSTSELVDSFPEKWKSFFTTMFNSYTNSDNVKRKAMVVFQLVYWILHNGGKKTPLH